MNLVNSDKLKFKMQLKTRTIFWTVLILVFSFSQSCQEDKPDTPSPPKKEVKVPKFNRDSSYAIVGRQVNFGPRVTKTVEHTACKDWLVSQFKRYGATVIEQDFEAKAYTGTLLKATNIIAQFNPENKKRVLLTAHWDTRPIADYDPDEANHDKPIPGADDGASGVGILLEIARQINLNPIDLGVDIVLFDAEDYGESKGEDYKTWCLGSQHWGKNLHKSGYHANFGILLDMAGAKNARFTMDETSMTFAPAFMRKVWKLAQGMGYGSYFVSEQTQILIDDHLFVNQLTGIPTIDIINRPLKSKTGFGDYWHTLGDDMSVIDKRTLRAVGQTVLAVVYHENNGTF